jgi:hypothetical protein
LCLASKKRCISPRELLKSRASRVLSLATAERLDIEGRRRRRLWCRLRLRLRLEACGCRASLAPGRRASRVANRQQKRTRSRVKRMAHAVDKSRKIVDQLALSLQPGSRQLLAGARIIVSHLFAPF